MNSDNKTSRPVPRVPDNAAPPHTATLTPLLFCGGPICGQKTLAAQLEGHPDIFSIPMWHDCTAAHLGYCLQRMNQSVPVDELSQEYVKYLYFFKILNTAQNTYEILQLAAQTGYMNFSLDSKRTVPVPFDFSFSSFSAGLFTDLRDAGFIKLPKHLPQHLPHFFHAIFKNLHAQVWNEARPLPRYGASMMPVDFFRYELMQSIYPEAKCLFIRRDPIDAFAAIIVKNAQQLNRSVDKFLHTYCNSDNALRIVKNMQRAEHVAKTQPNFMLIIDFADLTLNTEQTLRKVCAHIDVEYMPILQQATFLCKPINPDIQSDIRPDIRPELNGQQLDSLKKYVAYLRQRARQELGE